MPASAPIDPARILPELELWSAELGFSGLAVSRAELAEDHALMQAWVAAGKHGEMDYLARNPDLRLDPAALVPGTLSVISVRLPYWPPQAQSARDTLRDADRAYISRYALGRDYHKVVRGKLRTLARRLQDRIGPFGHRAFADSAPVLEKALARDASLGWIGKNTLLLDAQQGSYFFLGELFTDLPLPASTRPAARNQCGQCQACIRVCPTGAISATGELDARRCISYLTIELKGAIPLEFRQAIGNRIFGCDDCQLFCPWNRDASPAEIGDFKPRHGLDQASLLELFNWTEAEFLKRTEGMAIRRVGYSGWLRNLAVALGNGPPASAVLRALATRATDSMLPDLVREHADWALQRLKQRCATEPDPAA